MHEFLRFVILGYQARSSCLSGKVYAGLNKEPKSFGVFSSSYDYCRVASFGSSSLETVEGKQDSKTLSLRQVQLANHCFFG